MATAQILSNLGTAFGEIFKSMSQDLSIWWFLGPILFFWLILEIYFSEYKDEKLGWNTALGNSLSVFWSLVISMKYLFENSRENFEWIKFLALILFLLYTTFIIYNSFSHKLSAKVSFLLAAPTITYYLSAIAILWTYGELILTIWVVIDLVIIYGIGLLFELILRKLIKGKGSGLGGGMDFGKKPDFGSSELGGGLGGGLGGLK